MFFRSGFIPETFLKYLQKLSNKLIQARDDRANV